MFTRSGTTWSTARGHPLIPRNLPGDTVLLRRTSHHTEPLGSAEGDIHRGHLPRPSGKLRGQTMTQTKMVQEGSGYDLFKWISHLWIFMIYDSDLYLLWCLNEFMMSDCDDDATLPIQKAVGHWRTNADFVNSNAWKWKRTPPPVVSPWHSHGPMVPPKKCGTNEGWLGMLSPNLSGLLNQQLNAKS